MKNISDMSLAEVTLAILKAAVNIPDGMYARAQFLASQELRALLDAPAKPVEPVAYPTLSALLADLPEGYNKDDVAFGWNECVDNHRCSDAQPQGEQVYMVRSHGSDCWEEMSGESLELCQADPGEYEVRKLYAEQPAPVAVDVLITGFYTTESGGGKYAINIGFRSMADMQAADAQLRELLKSR